MGDTKPTEESGSNPFTGDLKKFIADNVHAWKVPGMSVAVIDGENTYTESFGHAILPDTKATADTLWYAGSATKAYTGAALAKILESKAHLVLSRGWNTPISSIIREDFVLQDAWATENVTLLDASCHRSGLGRHDLSMFQEIDGRPAKLVEHVRNMRNLSMAASPRERFIYSNHMYMTLSHVIETVTGKKLGDALRETLFKPLGMNSTYFGDEEAMAGPEDLSAAYSWNAKTKEFEKMPRSSVTEYSGTGAIVASITDLAKWVSCLLNETQPFSMAVHADIKTPRIIMKATPENGADIKTYGLGWIRTVYQGHGMYTHGGATTTHGCEIFWLPDLKFGVVAAGNTPRNSNFCTMAIAYKLIDDKIGVPKEKRIDFSAMLMSQEDGDKKLKDTAMEDMFPKRANPPLPPSVKTTELAGSYYNEGYGKMVFTAVPHPDKEGEMVLQAERRDMFAACRTRLEHASGNFWLACIKSLDGGEDAMSVPVRAEFHLGDDGKPSALEIDYTNVKLGVEYGKVLYKALDSA